GGDANFTTSSGAVPQLVNQSTVVQASTTTTLQSSLNPSSVGQSVTFTATVIGASGATGTPTGSVTFFDGATTLQVVPLSAAGTASISSSSLAAGTHAIRATYSGDTNFTSSAANLSQVVNRVATTTTVQSSANPSTTGQPVTLTAVVSGASGSTGSPT